VIGLAAVVIVFIAVKAFGGKDTTSSTTTTASAATAWADGTCGALVTWKDSVTAAAHSLKTTPTRDGVNQAVDDAKSATKTLADTVRGLDAPGTAAGAKAHDTISSLETQMQTGVSKLQSAAGKVSGLSGTVEAVSTISTTLVTMRDQLSAAADALRGLPTGELQDAVASSPSCGKLKSGSSSS